MQLMLRRDQPMDRLASRIACANAPSAGPLDDIATTCERLATLKRAGKTGGFDAFCKSGAWVDAVLALVAHELPGWSVRRLVQDSGLWFCALSRAPNLPTELDEMVEASHEDMALAILFAFVEARRAGKVAAPAAGSVPATSVTAGYRMCCDNFS
jgi:hypothetical protein